MHAVVPRWDGRWQPLVAVYRRTVLTHLEAQLALGARRMMDLIERLAVRAVEADDVRRFDPDGTSFFRMNRPADYAEALDRWRRESPRGHAGHS